MTYQLIYSSESTMPMQSEDLQALLERARSKNAGLSISGALVYADGTFLQILEGDLVSVQALMATIEKDLRHEHVTVLREGEVPAAKFASWKMAYVSATPEQVARWAGIGIGSATDAVVNDDGDDGRRTTQFAQDILALLAHDEPAEPGGPARR